MGRRRAARARAEWGRRAREGAVPGDVFAFVVMVVSVTAALAVHLTGVLSGSRPLARQALACGLARGAIAHAQYRLMDDGQDPYRIYEGTDAAPSGGRDTKALFDSLGVLDRKAASENDIERAPAFLFLGAARGSGKWQGLLPEDGALYDALSPVTCQVRVSTQGLDSDVLGTDDRTLGQLAVSLAWSDEGGAQEHTLVQVVRAPAQVEP